MKERRSEGDRGPPKHSSLNVGDEVSEGPGGAIADTDMTVDYAVVLKRTFLVQKVLARFSDLKTRKDFLDGKYLVAHKLY